MIYIITKVVRYNKRIIYYNKKSFYLEFFIKNILTKLIVSNFNDLLMKLLISTKIIYRIMYQLTNYNYAKE